MATPVHVACSFQMYRLDAGSCVLGNSWTTGIGNWAVSACSGAYDAVPGGTKIYSPSGVYVDATLSSTDCTTCTPVVCSREMNSGILMTTACCDVSSPDPGARTLAAATDDS